nr:LPXTG cell wall anchor domain-containing protein [Limosilactobacillus reuteri]
MLGNIQTAALPGEFGKPIDWDLIGGYGLKPHDPATPNDPETPTTPETPETPNTPETPKQPETQTNNRLPQTGNNANKAIIGLGMGTLLSMFGLAGINKRRVN